MVLCLFEGFKMITDDAELLKLGYKKSGSEKKLNGGLGYRHGGIEQKYIHQDKPGHFIKKQVFKNGNVFVVSRNKEHKDFKKEPLGAFSTSHSAVMFNENVVQMPGTHRWTVGDKVTHPDHEGTHVLYSIPTVRDGRDPKTIAIIHPENDKNVANFKKVKLRDLKKV